MIELKKLRKIFLTVSCLLLLMMSGAALSKNGSVPNRTYTINIKFDPSTGEFYELAFNNSIHSSIEVISENEIKVMHTLDNLLGTTMNGPYDEGVVDTRKAEKSMWLQNISGNYESIEVATGIKFYSQGRTSTNNNFYTNSSNSGCSYVSSSVYERPFIIEVTDPYTAAYCRTRRVLNNGDFFPSEPEISYIVRHFKFDLNKLKVNRIGTYTGTYVANVQAYFYNGQTAVQNYIYNVVLEVVPSLTEISVLAPNLEFKVDKTHSYIEGAAETSFNINGFFNDNSKINITPISLNALQCDGKLCLFNAETRKAITYEMVLVDASSAIERKFNRSEQTEYIVPNFKNQSYGNVKFHFSTKDTSLSGTFTDVLTLRAALSLE